MTSHEIRHDRLMTLLVALFALGFFVAIGFWPAGTPPVTRDLPTAGFRRHHEELKNVLGDWTLMVDALHDASPSRQSEIMDFSVGFLKQHVLTHTAVEERILYPAVERYAGRELTLSLREEHRLLRSRVRDLEATPEAATFCHRAHEVAGLLAAHFDVEEAVLLPVLDRRMTPEQFRREVWARMLSEMD